MTNFTRTNTTRTVSVSNTFLDANAWFWAYGDGTTVTTEKILAHTYAIADTYTITLTAKGALANFNSSTFTIVVTIP